MFAKKSSVSLNSIVFQKDPEFKTPKAYKTKPRLTSTQNTPQRFLTPVQPSHKPSNSAFRRGFNDQDLREELVSPSIQSPYVCPQFTSNSSFHYLTTSPGTPFIDSLNAQSRFEFPPQNTPRNPLKRPGTSVGGSTKKQRFSSDQVSGYSWCLLAVFIKMLSIDNSFLNLV